MPTRNSNKQYVEGGYYHIYNRGVEKRDIFIDSQDYDIFLGFLKEYLTAKDERALNKALSNPALKSVERQKLNRTLQMRNYSQEIILLAFCLKPNHFHFFVKQNTADAIDRFMSSLCTRYTTYFNRRHKRVGALYQGVYKAVLIEDDSQYLHISRYIHKQSLRNKQLFRNSDRNSSYPEYLGLRQTDWVHPEEIISFFSQNDPNFSYEKFVDEYEPLDDLKDSGGLI